MADLDYITKSSARFRASVGHTNVKTAVKNRVFNAETYTDKDRQIDRQTHKHTHNT